MLCDVRINRSYRNVALAGLWIALASSAAGFAPRVRAQVTRDADADARARMHFQAGRSYFDEGAYERSLSEFETAYRLSPRPSMLLNLANVSERLGRPAAASDYLRRYLTEVPNDEGRATIERRIANLETQQAAMDAATAEQQRRDREAAEAAARESTEATEPEVPERRRRNLAVPLVAYGVGAAGGLMAAVSGPMALSEDDEVASGCGATHTCSSSDVARIERLALLTDVGIGIAAAGAITGTVLLFVGPGAKQDDAEPQAAFIVVPSVGRSSIGFVAVGSF